MANQINDIFITEDDCFYFESDHLALKGNKDYYDVLKTLMILTAQQRKALLDFNKIVELKKEALEDPISILEQIKSGKELDVPPMFELPKIPVINFEKYNVKVPDADLKMIYSESSTNSSKEDSINVQQSNCNNRAWSPEEQKRLEELLIIFPPEPVEMRRFQKIARALGNRTVQQVCSRVQKYFLKLYKAGLPIPGRIPKSSEKYKRSMIHKHQRHNHYLWKPTTFFPKLCLPVTMNELDNIPGPELSTSHRIDLPSKSSNYLIPSESEPQSIEPLESNSNQQLKLLKRVKTEKLNEVKENYNLFHHVGFRCDYCDTEPIVGSRWHCETCVGSVDFCIDCVVSQMFSDDPHPLNHNLITIHNDTEAPNMTLNELEND